MAKHVWDGGGVVVVVVVVAIGAGVGGTGLGGDLKIAHITIPPTTVAITPATACSSNLWHDLERVLTEEDDGEEVVVDDDSLIFVILFVVSSSTLLSPALPVSAFFFNSSL